MNRWGFIILISILNVFESFHNKCKNRTKSQSFLGSAMLFINQTSLFFELVNSMIVEGEMEQKGHGRNKKVGSESAVAQPPLAV